MRGITGLPRRFTPRNDSYCIVYGITGLPRRFTPRNDRGRLLAMTEEDDRNDSFCIVFKVIRDCRVVSLLAMTEEDSSQ